MASFRKEFSLDKIDLQGMQIGIFEEPGAEGNFVINYFIWESLREQDGACCLLSLKHSFNHYFHIGMKLGYNLNSQKSRAIFLEALRALFESNTEQNFFNMLDDTGLKKLFHIVKEKCEHLLKNYNKVYLIIDDLSYLLCAGFPVESILVFGHYLRTLLDKNITVIVLAHYSEDDRESLRIKHFLEQNIDINFQVSPLRTGAAQDISGMVSMKRKNNTLEKFTDSILCHYKLTERNINVFPPGYVK
ncbi:elongator complex protein 6 [Rhodnius prolixus]|uniref:Elongator complex protein 6 n=1 Tax=Rhodnius prolixus TaxID=13249 RepID=T1I1F3_RHOPR